MDALPIKAGPLIQHADGVRSHHCLPSFAAGDAERWQTWLQEQRLEVMQVWMEDDAEATDIYRNFWAAMRLGRCQLGSHVNRTAKKHGFARCF